ncbi:MAG TPA: flagellar biosynthetic protein FliO [Syntrophorhabdaceae bacterium]|nr:flagellar biosynthetic protein FliO [Syntrophorhabdaceae bacterium]HPU29851.1 flagellar biosynthetic protein FliO [Syntrophorhabdaceae bacterium]
MEMFLDLLKVIFALLFIVSFMVLLYKYGDKFKIGIKKTKSPYSLKKMDTIYLGARKSISIIEVDDHVLVLGVGDKEIRTLLKWKKTKESV